MENYIISLVDTENTLGKTHPTQRENGQPNFSISIQSDIVHQKKKKIRRRGRLSQTSG